MNIFLENQIIKAVLIVLVFYVGSFIVTFIMSLIEKVTAKTKSDIDDKIIEAAKLPVRYLSILLGFFFATELTTINFAYKDFGFNDLFYLLISILVAFTVSRIVKVLLSWYGGIASEKSYLNETMFIFLRKVISFSVYMIALVFILGHFGIEIGPLIAGLGVAGLAIALGLKETMANLFAALFLVLDKSINVGDHIQLEDGTKAFIEDISWRSVRIRTIAGNTVIVPNSKFVGQNISSYDYPEKEMTTSVAVGVAYDSDLEKVEYVAKQAGQAVIEEEGVKVKENNPTIRFQMLGPSSIDLSIYLRIENVKDEGKIKSALIKKVISEFKKAEIEIPFPQMDVVIKK